jgi:predicted nucleic acid-binding protein
VIAYIDASVVLRLILKDQPVLAEWDDLELGVASPLLRVECRRTFDRLWHQGHLDEELLTAKQKEADVILERFIVVPLDEDVLAGASLSLPTILKTLDAIHLASAIHYRRAQPPDERALVMATHDGALAAAARAMRFDVIGIE